MSKETSKYTIANTKGMNADILSLGAIVAKLFVPDKNGNPADVLLGYDDIKGFKSDGSFQGAIVGRYGNRIGNSKFELDGIEYKLTSNEGSNQLHGGSNGFNKVEWTAEEVNDNSVTLSYDSPDGEEGYPGNVKITVKYSITEDNELKIEYSGTTDKPTVLNPTNHCYFNLTGNPDNLIVDHVVRIDADYITPVNDQMIPTGELMSVDGTPMDFRSPKVVGEEIEADFEQLKLGGGYDHNFVLNNFNGSAKIAASVHDPVSGRVLEVITDQPGIQFYSGNFLDQSTKGKGNKPMLKRSGLCLEAQGFPDSPNKPQFPSVVLRPDEVYIQTTIYKFSSK